MANKEKLKAALRQRQAGVSALVEAIKKLPCIVPSDLSAKEQWERNGEYVERDAVLDLLATAPPEQADFALPEQRDLTPEEQKALRRVYAKLYKPADQPQ